MTRSLLSITVVFGVVSGLLLLVSQARADVTVPCPCKDSPLVESLGRDRAVLLARIAELNTSITNRFSAIDGVAFYRSPEQIESYKLTQQYNRILKDMPCLSQMLIPNLGLTFVSRASTDSIFLKFPKNDWNLSTLKNIPGYGGDPATLTTTIQNAPITSLTKLMGGDLTQAVALKMLFHSEGQSLEASAAPYASMLSPTQKFQVAQNIMDAANGFYTAKSLPRPMVSNNQTLDAARQYILNVNAGTSGTAKAGDCADIANLGGAVLEALKGFKNIYTATGTDAQGPHTILLAQFPAVPGQPAKWGKADYSAASFSGPAEGGALLRWPSAGGITADLGPGYFISRVNGQTVGYVPSEMGTVLAELAGMNSVVPMAKSTASLVAVQVEVPLGGTAQIFTGRDRIGDVYSGVSYHGDWEKSAYYRGSAGIVADYRIAPVIGPAAQASMVDFYGQIENQFKTPNWEIARDVRVRLDTTATLLASYAAPVSPVLRSDKEYAIGAGAFLTTGIQAVYGGPRSDVSVKTRAEVQLTPGFTNMSGSTFVPVMNYAMFTVEGRRKLAETPEGFAYLAAATGAMLTNFGPQIFAKLGIETPILGARVEVRGRVLESGATIPYGSLRTIESSARWTPTRAISILVNGKVVAEEYFVAAVGGVAVEVKPQQ